MIEAEGDEPNQIFDIAIILNCCSVVKRTIELTRNQWDDSSDDMQKHIYIMGNNIDLFKLSW